MYDYKLTGQSTSSGMFSIQDNFTEWDFTEWDYDAIDKCVIIPSKYTGQSFSLMLIIADRDRSMIGIPKRIDLKQVAQMLSSMNVDVSMGRKVPTAYTTGIAMSAGVAAPVVGVSMLIAGFAIGAGDGGGNRRTVECRESSEFDSGPLPNAPSPSSGSVPEQSSPPATRTNPASPPERDIPVATNSIVPRGFVLFPGTTSQQSASTPRSQPPGDNSGGAATTIPDTGPEVTSGKGLDSELLGGKGGGPFRKISPNGHPVVAVQYAMDRWADGPMGRWAGKDHVGQLTPLFERVHASSGQQLIVARQGYALGAMQVDADDLVDSIRFVFMQIKADGSLNEEDSYSSDWIGNPNEQNIRTISGTGSLVVGFHGRGAAVIDIVGLVFGASSP